MDTDSSSERQSAASVEMKKQGSSDGSTWMMEKQHIDAVINFLLRLACQVRTDASLRELECENVFWQAFVSVFSNSTYHCLT